jgi:hypothetical protein
VGAVMLEGTFIMPEMVAHFFFLYTVPSATSRENGNFCERLNWRKCHAVIQAEVAVTPAP